MQDIKIKRRNFGVRRGERSNNTSKNQPAKNYHHWQRKENSAGLEIAGREFSREYYQQNHSPIDSFLKKISRHHNLTENRFSSTERKQLQHRHHSSAKKKLSVFRKIIGTVIMLVGMILLFLLTSLTSIDIFFWLFFFAMFWYKLDSRISIAGALVGLVVIMFLSAGQGFGWWKTDNLQEQIAVAVYFFLVIGVLKQIWEYKTFG